MTSWSKIPLATLLLASLAACASSGHRYQDRNMDFGSVRTVAVMPFANLSRDNLASERVRDVFSNALLATEAVYVVPAGELSRAMGRIGIPNPTQPSVEEAVKLGTALKVDALIIGVVKEYGEVRSGTAVGNAVSISLQMQETATGKVVWSGTSTKGGVSFSDRMLGGGGTPLNYITEEAVDDLLNKLFR
jgi:polysaccharide biosynthesis protein PelC